MDNDNFLKLLHSLPQLTETQLERAQEKIRCQLLQEALGEPLTEEPEDRPVCPHCESDHVIHWGQVRGIQRYRCKGCERTFTQLNGTPLHRLHQRQKWYKYAQCLVDGVSLREAARICQINLKTSLRWRHRFLRYALEIEARDQGDES